MAAGVTGDFARLARQIKAMERFRSTWNRDLSTALAATAKAELQQQFNNGQDPYGHAYTPLAPSTIASRRKGKASGSDKILMDSTRMARSFTFRGTSGAILIGTNVVYAGVHQYGHTYAARSSVKPVTLHFAKGGGFIGRHGKGARSRSWSGHVSFGARTVPQRQMIPEGGNPGRWRAAFERDTRAWFTKTFKEMGR